MLMEDIICQQEQCNKEKLEMNEANNDKVVERNEKYSFMEGILGGIVLTCCLFVFAGLIGFLSGLKTQKQIEKDMVARGFGFYTCNDKTGEVKFEYYKLEDVDVITDKVYNEKKVK